MSNILTRGHRIYRLTLLQPTRRHIQLDANLPVPLQSTDSLPELVPEPSDSETSPRPKRFYTLYDFVRGGLGRPSKRVPSRSIRQTAWKKLFKFAETPAQLEQAANLIPRWRYMQRVWRGLDAEVFARRCEQLRNPLLALRVFTNHPKYGFPLSTPFAALQLIHSLATHHPLQQTITATALLSVPRFPGPPVQDNLHACAMLVSACFAKARSEPEEDERAKAKKLGEKFLPILRNLCHIAPSSAALPSFPSSKSSPSLPASTLSITLSTYSITDKRARVWLLSALRSLAASLSAEHGRESDVRWVRDAVRKFASWKVSPRAEGALHLEAPVVGVAATERLEEAVA